VELGKAIGVHEMTIVNWEVKEMTPCSRYLEKLRRIMPELATVAKDSY
jgi:DNA-binding XRE family transcriptional regulator